jgi:hypothetical protein
MSNRLATIAAAQKKTRIRRDVRVLRCPGGGDLGNYDLDRASAASPTVVSR